LHYIIDVKTHDVAKLLGKLSRLKSTLSAENRGQYHAAHSYSQVGLESTKTLEEIEDWLYKYSRCDYVGAVEHTPKEES